MGRTHNSIPLQRSIGTKLLAGVLVAALAPLLLLAITSYREQRAVALEDAFDRLEGAASAQVTQLERLVESDREIAGLFTSTPSLRAVLAGSGDAEALEAGLDGAVDEIPRLLAMTVVDTDDRIVATTDPTGATKLLESGIGPDDGGEILGVVTTDRRGDPIALSSFPVVVDGVTIGAVVIETDATAIGDLATNYEGLSATGETNVAQIGIGGEPEFIAPLRFDGDGATPTALPAAPATDPVVAALAGAAGRLGDVVDYRGETVLAVTRSVDGPGWGVVVKIDRAEALAGTESFRDALAGAWALGSVMVLLLGYLFARWVSRPVHRLTAAAEAVAAGDLEIRAESDRADELGALAAAVNTMTDSLVNAAVEEASRTGELETLNRQLSESEARVRAIFESAAEGIVHCDERGTILEFNQAAEEIFQRPAHEALGLPIASVLGVVSNSDGGRTIFDPTAALFDQAGHPGGDAAEMVARRAQGAALPVEVSVSRVEMGDTVSYTALIRDISERAAYERRLAEMATQDGLTGLPNRELLTSKLEIALVACEERVAGVSVLFIDLDRFKLVNDAWGHAAGDSLLRLVSRRLHHVLRAGDTIARVGGDEFVVLAANIPDASTAIGLGERLLGSLQEPFELGGSTTYVTASIGIATTFSSDTTADDLISQADVAMYRAKQAGRSRLEVFDSHMRSRVQARHELDTELRKAIDAGELDVHYQPIMRLDDGGFSGVEALVRWTHSDMGVVSPGEFVPAAEESGLIVPMGRFVLDRVCRQLAEWQQRYPATDFQISVNLSAREVMQTDCVEVVHAALLRHAADPRGLTVEVTESVLVTDATTAIENLRRLRGLGVKIALDDFGTGYSSLTYLRDMPVDIVKIDREFIAELEYDRGESTVVALVLGLGESMGHAVVGEGIETQEQHDEFVRLGGRLAQGFLYARPQPAERVEALLWPAEVIDLETLDETRS